MAAHARRKRESGRRSPGPRRANGSRRCPLRHRCRGPGAHRVLARSLGLSRVSSIDNDGLNGHAPLPRVIEQAQGDLWFGLLVEFLWHLRLLASLGILGPGLGQKQLGADGEMKRGAAGRIVGQILRTHDHLALANFAKVGRSIAQRRRLKRFLSWAVRYRQTPGCHQSPDATPASASRAFHPVGAGPTPRR